MTKQQKIEFDAHAQLTETVKWYAKQAGYATQAQIAGVAKITPQYLSDIVRGRREWRPERLALLAVKFGVEGKEWQRLGAIAAGWRIE